MAIYTTVSREETVSLGQQFAKQLKPGDVVFLEGGLGAGKTAFCTGIAQGLGCVDEASSPTYAIVNYYRGNAPLAHFDMYRITSEEDLFSTGFYDYIEEGTVIAVEWSEYISTYWNAPRFTVKMEMCDENTRQITILEGAQ